MLWFSKKNLTKALVMVPPSHLSLIQWQCMPIPEGIQEIEVVLRRRGLCALIVTCLDTLWTSITSFTVIHQGTSTKASLVPMLTKFHILKVKLLRFLLIHLLSVLFLRHSVSNCSLFSTLELIKLLITMLQMLVQMLLSLACFLAVAAGVTSTSITPSDSVNSTFVDTMSGINSLLHFTPSLKHSVFSAKVANKEVFHATNWVIDTGATDHMVHSIACFTTITATLNTYVNLPNGEVASVTHVGIVKILEHLILHNVLCVPSFSFNLISVSQLAKSTTCCLIFFGNLCSIQDLAHWSTLGLGKESNGLYLLDKSNISTLAIAVSVYSSQVQIRHSRLGHLSNAKLASIKPNDVPSFTSVENFNYDICPIAKQKRLPFNKSSHLSKSCFDLIHCDLWGPFSVSTIDHCKYFLTIVDDYSRCTWVYLL